MDESMNKRKVFVSIEALIIWFILLAGFTVVVVLQGVLIFGQWKAERTVLTILASQAPSPQLEDLLNRYFMPQKIQSFSGGNGVEKMEKEGKAKGRGN